MRRTCHFFQPELSAAKYFARGCTVWGLWTLRWTLAMPIVSSFKYEHVYARSASWIFPEWAMLAGGCFALQAALWASLHNAFTNSVMSLIFKVKYMFKHDVGSELQHTVPALCEAQDSKMLGCRACWEEEQCDEHSNKDITPWFRLPGETSLGPNDLHQYTCVPCWDTCMIKTVTK